MWALPDNFDQNYFDTNYKKQFDDEQYQTRTGETIKHNYYSFLIIRHNTLTIGNQLLIIICTKQCEKRGDRSIHLLFHGVHGDMVEIKV